MEYNTDRLITAATTIVLALVLTSTAKAAFPNVINASGEKLNNIYKTINTENVDGKNNTDDNSKIKDVDNSKIKDVDKSKIKDINYTGVKNVTLNISDSDPRLFKKDLDNTMDYTVTDAKNMNLSILNDNNQLVHPTNFNNLTFDLFQLQSVSGNNLTIDDFDFHSVSDGVRNVGTYNFMWQEYRFIIRHAFKEGTDKKINMNIIAYYDISTEYYDPSTKNENSVFGNNTTKLAKEHAFDESSKGYNGAKNMLAIPINMTINHIE